MDYNNKTQKHETLNPSLMLARGLRRWPKIEPALVQRLVFAQKRPTFFKKQVMFLQPIHANFLIVCKYLPQAI